MSYIAMQRAHTCVRGRELRCCWTVYIYTRCC